MDIRAAEISKVIRDQIASFGTEAEVSETGQVLSVGDGIARVYGLDNVQAGELVEFENGVRGMTLNLEIDNVGIVIFGNDRDIDAVELLRFVVALVDLLLVDEGVDGDRRLAGLAIADDQLAQLGRIAKAVAKRRQAGPDRLQLPLVPGELEQGCRISARQTCLNAAGILHARLYSQIGI